MINFVQLHVVFRRPLFGNYQHCCLYLEDEEEPLIIEVTGEHPNFERNIVKGRAEDFADFLRKIYVGLVRRFDVGSVKRAAETVPVDNETVEWDCQEFVLDVLGYLEELFSLDCDDEDYRDAREILRNKRVAIV